MSFRTFGVYGSPLSNPPQTLGRFPEPLRGIRNHAGYLNQPRGMRNPSAVGGMENGGGPHKKTELLECAAPCSLFLTRVRRLRTKVKHAGVGTQGPVLSYKLIIRPAHWATSGLESKTKSKENSQNPSSLRGGVHLSPISPRGHR